MSQSHGIVSTTSEDQQQQDWILDNLEAIEQYYTPICIFLH